MEEQTETKIRKVIILPDVHLTTKLPKSYKIVKRFIRSFKPDEIIILGDFMDCSSLSHWNESKSRAIEGQRYLKEVEVANKELDFLQRYSKKVTFVEGNHENWCEQYIEKHPEMEGLIEIPLKLRLKERGIEWCPMNTLYKMGSLYFTHGCYTVKYHASKHLQAFGCNICYGHTHRFDAFQMVMKMQKPYVAYGLGCLCDKDPSYMKGRPNSWISQFGVVYFNEKGDFDLYPINIINNRFMFEGKEHK